MYRKVIACVGFGTLRGFRQPRVALERSPWRRGSCCTFKTAFSLCESYLTKETLQKNFTFHNSMFIRFYQDMENAWILYVLPRIIMKNHIAYTRNKAMAQFSISCTELEEFSGTMKKSWHHLLTLKCFIEPMRPHWVNSDQGEVSCLLISGQQQYTFGHYYIQQNVTEFDANFCPGHCPSAHARS